MRLGLQKYRELKMMAGSMIHFHLQRVEAILRDSNEPVTLEDDFKKPATMEEDLQGLMEKVVNFKMTLWCFHPHFTKSLQESDAFQRKVTDLLKGACRVSQKASPVEDDCGSLRDLKTCVDHIVKVLSLVHDNVTEASFNDVSFQRSVFEDKGYLKKMSSVVGTVAGLSTLSKQTVRQFMVLFFKLMKKKPTPKEIDCAVAPILRYLNPAVSPVDVRQFDFLGQCINKRNRDGATAMVKEVGGEVDAEGVMGDKSGFTSQILSYQ